MRAVVLIIHNVRSAHNVGSLLRTAEGLGVREVIISGYSPHPNMPGDQRLPHEAAKTARAIAKTSLGAEKTLNWRQQDIKSAISRLRDGGYVIAALEQAPGAAELAKYRPPEKIALIVGNEVSGLEPDIMAAASVKLEIPMAGQKESFNVSAAAAMALFYLMNY